MFTHKLNGPEVIGAVQSALHSRTSGAQLLSEFLSAEQDDAPDGTNGATKSARAVDPSQGLGVTRPRGSRDPLLAAMNKIVNR